MNACIPAVVLQVLPRAAFRDVLDNHLPLGPTSARRPAAVTSTAGAGETVGRVGPRTFDSESTTSEPVPVPAVNRVVGVARVGVLDEGKAWAASATFDLNAADPAVFVKQVVNLAFADVVWQVAYVEPATVCRLPALVTAAAAAPVVPVVPSIIVVS